MCKPLSLANRIIVCTLCVRTYFAKFRSQLVLCRNILKIVGTEAILEYISVGRYLEHLARFWFQSLLQSQAGEPCLQNINPENLFIGRNKSDLARDVAYLSLLKFADRKEIATVVPA